MLPAQWRDVACDFVGCADVRQRHFEIASVPQDDGGDELAKMITRMWLATEFEGGRHQRRVNQINASECGVVIEDQVDPGVG